jgi:hypothetical protein
MSFSTFLPELSETQLGFALLLRDRLTFENTLAGTVTVTTVGLAGTRKSTSGTFVFFNPPKGKLDFAVRSDPATPYYIPVDLTLTIPPPSPTLPAFPDISLADRNLMLWDPGQPAAWRTQFLQACLSPTVAYPFDSGATLVRGTVLQGGQPLAGVTVFDTAGTALPYATAADGQFVLLLPEPPALPSPVTIRARRAGNPDVDAQVTVTRAATVTLRINL